MLREKTGAWTFTRSLCENHAEVVGHSIAGRPGKPCWAREKVYLPSGSRSSVAETLSFRFDVHFVMLITQALEPSSGGGISHSYT